MRTGLAFTLAALALLAGCVREVPTQTFRIAAFGTEVVVVLVPEAGADPDRAVAAVDSEMQRMHRRWHAWEPGLLAEINRAIAEGRGIELPQDVIEPIERARELERRSGGLFNPAIGRLLSLWGFHASELPTGPAPADEAIAALVKRSPSSTDLVIEGRRLSSRNPAVKLDFGAYIKGVAVERALAILADAGIRHAIVNAGGDLGVIGRRGDRAWRAAVQHPDGAGGRYIAGLEVRDGEFVFTSGNYRRYRRDEGARHGHIIDPRDGYPADQVASVTVVADEGGLADAAATALAVAGPGEWIAVANRLGVDRVMRVAADGSIEITPAMAARLVEGESPARMKVVPLGRETRSAPGSGG